MRYVFLYFLLTAVAGTALADEPAPTDAPFALVELYTSEGCSSCPPADQVAADLHERAERTGERIFVLGFHVDYWNRLGWEDPFSDASFTERQREYARDFGENRVYTPAMIVNGDEPFVGSHRKEAEDAVSQALDDRAEVAVGVRVWANRDEPRSLRISWNATGVPAGADLAVALVEGDVTSRVTRGENNGRTLSHVGVVRWFHVEPAADAAKPLRLELPAGVNAENAAVVVFLQDRRTRRVLGAARAEVPAIQSAP